MNPELNFENGLKLPWEICDTITNLTLQDVRKDAIEQLENHNNGTKPLPDSEVGYQYNLLRALNVVLRYYGENEVAVKLV
jgi:hypothetical protein